MLFTRPAATVDEYVSQLNDILTHLLDKFAPARTRRRRPQKWLSAEAVEAKRTHRRLERRWRATGDEADRLAYRRECSKANRLINESRTNHYRRRIQESGSDYTDDAGGSSTSCFALRTQTKLELTMKTDVCVPHLPIRPTLLTK